MEDKIKLLLKTIDVNLMMHREVGTNGYKLRALEAFEKIESLVENEEAATGKINVLEFRKVA